MTTRTNSCLKSIVVGNAHCDEAWKWLGEEGKYYMMESFRDVVCLMSKYECQLAALENQLNPGQPIDRQAQDKLRFFNRFIFVSGCSEYYEYVERQDPQLFEQIRCLVKRGRWEIVGGTYNEPDENKPCGETLTRQYLTGVKYFQEKFGPDIRITAGFNPDAFGHPDIWEILAKSGINSYVYLRPGPDQVGMDSRINRHYSQSGQSVLGYRLPYSYCTGRFDLTEHINKCLSEAPASLGKGLIFFGHGDHGGGPTEENMESLWSLLQAGAPIEFGSVASYVNDLLTLESEGAYIPAGPSDLQTEAAGTWSNDLLGNLLLSQTEAVYFQSETAASMATMLCGSQYPAKELKDILKLILQSTFHDRISFTGTVPVNRETRQLLQEANVRARKILSEQLRRISRRIDTIVAEKLQADNSIFVIVNTHPWKVREQVRLELLRPFNDGDSVVDDLGNEVPFQKVTSRSGCLGEDDIIIETDLPPTGYRTYKVIYQNEKIRFAIETDKRAETQELENEFYRLGIDLLTGLFTLRDKRIEADLIVDGGNLLVLRDANLMGQHQESGDDWGHEINAFGPVIGPFACTHSELVEDGPLFKTIRLYYGFEDQEGGISTFVQDWTLKRGSDRIELRLVPDIAPSFTHKMVKLSLPINVSEAQLYAQTPTYKIQRAFDGLEHPKQSFLQVQGIPRNGSEKAPCTLEISDNGIYGFDAYPKVLAAKPEQGYDELPTKYTVNLSILRTPVANHHMPKNLGGSREWPFKNIGRVDEQTVEKALTFSLRVVPGTVGGEVFRSTREMKEPPIVMRETKHPGDLPPSASFFEIDDNLDLRAMKISEEGKDLVVRVHNTSRSARSQLSVNFPAIEQTFEQAFKTGETLTLKFPLAGEKSVIETNSLEEN